MLRRSLAIGILALTVLSLPAFAHEGREGKEWDGKAHTEKLTKDLNLTPDQATKIQAILDQKHEHMKAKMEETHAAINQVLTSEQRTKYDAMREEQKKNWENKKKDGEHGEHHKHHKDKE